MNAAKPSLMKQFADQNPDVVHHPAGLDEPYRLFVYGTLRPSLYPGVIQRFDLNLVGRATLHGHWQMVSLGPYPGLIQTTPNGHPDDGGIIVGEVVETYNLARLDQYEGYPNHYARTTVEVTLDNGKTVSAFVYYLPRPGFAHHQPVPGNDWANCVPSRVPRH